MLQYFSVHDKILAEKTRLWTKTMQSENAIKIINKHWYLGSVLNWLYFFLYLYKK